MKTRCIVCREDRPVRDCLWHEPSPLVTDDSAVVIRGWICEDCEVVNWAQPYREGSYV